MPDLTGLPALDVAIGLSFIFLLLSLVASTLQEFIANLLSLRAKTLEQGLRNMLADSTPAPAGSAAARPPADQAKRDLLYNVYVHPLIRSLYKEGRLIGRTTLKPAAETEATPPLQQQVSAIADKVKDVRLPSYISPRSFALALIDTITPGLTVTGTDGKAKEPHDVIKATRAAIETLNIPSGVKHRLLALLDDARGDIDRFRHNIEAWFDDTMARVSGWYKRQAQIIIVVLAVLITVALNANTLTIGERLWHDPTLRATLVQQAGKDSTFPTGKDAQENLNNAIKNVEAVKQTGVPLGWAQGKKQANDPRHVRTDGFKGWATWLGGWLLTILAVSLGAPFWFDTLGRLSRLRGTGKPETPLPATGRGLPNERVDTATPTPTVNVTVQQPPPGAQQPGAQHPTRRRSTRGRATRRRDLTRATGGRRRARRPVTPGAPPRRGRNPAASAPSRQMCASGCREPFAWFVPGRTCQETRQSGGAAHAECPSG